MKRVAVILFLVVGFFKVSSQTAPPQRINYQGIARDASGATKANYTFTGVKFIIHQTTAAGNATFTETHNNVVTNASGVFVLQIGSISSLSLVPWGTDDFFLEVQVNDNGSGFITLGPIQQMISVPYALYAENVKNAPVTNIATNGIATSNFSSPNNYTISVPTPSLSINMNTITITQGTFTTWDTISVNPSNQLWHKPNTGIVALLNTGDMVGIGTNTPQAKLDVFGLNASTTFSMTNINTGSYTGSGFYSNSNATTTRLQNNSSGFALHALQSHPTNSTAIAAFIEGGLLTKGKSNNNQAYSFKAQNLSGIDLMIVLNDGKVGIGTNTPNYRLEVRESVFGTPAIWGQNTFTTSNPSAHGVYGETSNLSGLAAGVFGISTGNGPGLYGAASGSAPAVYGWKNSGGFGGSAGKFEVLNNSDALLGIATGTGAAIHAISGAALSSSLALWVDNGHIKATQQGTLVVGTSTLNTTGTSPTYTVGNSNDVRGVIQIVGFSGINSGNAIEVLVSFIKSYSLAPTVVITPYGNELLTYTIRSVSPMGFAVRISNNTSGSVSIPGLFRFAYMVIE